MKKLIEQILKFGVVGGLSTLLDYVITVFLHETFGVDLVIASGIGFTISVIFNYICSMRFVFVGRDEMSKKREFTIFLVLSVIGLGMNMGIIELLKGKFFTDYIGKIIATIVVLVWNFVTRKIFLEKKS